MKITRVNGMNSIVVPGLTIYSVDEDLLYPALMLIQLDRVVKYSQENRKAVLVVSGDEEYRVINVNGEENGT